VKKIINGKRYDTETAKEVAGYRNGLGGNDFRNISENLYKTKKGSWFLAGEGGPMTKYSRPCGNMTAGGSDIIPLSDEEALNWLDLYDKVEAIEKYFKDSIEDA